MSNQNINIKFLVDECTGPNVAKWLTEMGYTVYSIFDNNPGLGDEVIIQKAQAENWVIITNDKDFGDLIFRDHFKHSGVILLRLQNERSSNKINGLKRVLEECASQIKNNFVVVTETNIRVIVTQK